MSLEAPVGADLFCPTNLPRGSGAGAPLLTLLAGFFTNSDGPSSTIFENLVGPLLILSYNGAFPFPLPVFPFLFHSLNLVMVLEEIYLAASLALAYLAYFLLLAIFLIVARIGDFVPEIRFFRPLATFPAGVV